MSRLPVSLGAAATVLAVLAAAGFVTGGGVGVAFGVASALLALLLATAAFGLARDPKAREAAAARIAAARGEVPAVPVVPSAAAVEPVEVEDTMSEGFTVAAARRRPQDHRPKQSGAASGKRRRR